LRRFESGDLRILVTCKTLDEGLNITHTDVGIVVSSTGSRRQRLQRLGRVLRKAPDKKPARFYYLFIGGTTEEEELLNEITAPEYNGLINRIDLTYNKMAGTFENYKYTQWENQALQTLHNNGRSPEEITEFLRNTDAAILTDDWLMPKNNCIEKLNNATQKSERNYYIAVLLLIRARKSSFLF
jgi:superfamily II DNA or RNA helicase